MKTLEKTAGKFSRVSLALLLAFFVCACPPTMAAFAEEDADEPNTTEAIENEDPTMEAADEDADAIEEAADGEEAEAPADELTEADEAHEAGATEAAPQAADPDDAASEAAAQDASSFTVSSAEELDAAITAISSSSANETFTINLTGDFDLSSVETIATGKSVVIEGNGHTVTLDSSAQFDVNGTLTLNGALTIEETGSHSGSMFVVTGGTLNMSSGVTLEGSGQYDGRHGGGVSLSTGATFNMNGGTIENFQAAQGGGVFIADSRPRAISTFTMSGDATIRNNVGTNVGGGVYVGVRSVFTMEGNAAVVDNHADAAGGVMNYGQSTLTTVYNNTSKNGAADIFNFSNAMLKLSPTNPDWVLTRTGTHVTGWYIDNYHITDGDGNQGNGQHRWNPALDDTVEYTPTDGFTREQLYLIAGAPLINITWENEDGTVLYTMTKGEQDPIPTADQYTTLSGNANPTEPPSDGYEHNFTGWIETHPADNQVVYIAEYDDVPETHDGTTPTPGTDDPTALTPGTDDSTTPVPGSDGSPASQPVANTSTQADAPERAGLAQTGDIAMGFALAAGLFGVAGLITLVYARTRISKEQ